MIERDLGQTLAVVLAAAMLVASGCSNDKKEDFIDGDPPDMVTDVDSIVFVGIAQGSTDTQTLTVMNVGKGDLDIDSVKLVEETLDDSGQEFQKGSNWVNSLVLGQDEVLRISVDYTPGDKQPDNGHIELRTNDPKHPGGIARIPLETPALAPRIYAKENITFRRVPPVNDSTRNKFWQLTEVQNIGQVPLNVTDLVLAPRDSDFSVSFPETTDMEADPADDAEEFDGQLEPGASFPVRVYFNPIDDQPSTAEIILYSNDPATPEYTVNLLGNSGSPCLQLSEEDEINFGEGAIGYANNKTVIVENCSASSDLTLSAIEVCTFVDDTTCDSAEPTFALKEGSLPGDLPGADAILSPQQTSSFVLTYTPEDLSVSNGELMIASDDPAKSQLTLPIVGKGTDNQCPQAVAEASIAGVNRWEHTLNTIPLKTVEFRSSSSIDPDGTIDRYEWNIVQRPPGSTARMTPSNAVAEPSLFLDLAGEYVIELKAFDDRGTESCGEQAIVTINATPDEDIHVQLVWDTPGDNDQTDRAGTDVDLHFLHPNGTWNFAPWDIYWSNPTADWGAPGDERDDPSLDIDDIDGAGPENVNLDGPEDGIEYNVGVYYFADNGYGPSYATVRIFIGGIQQYEKEQLLSQTDEFWHVGTISWPTTQFDPSGDTQLYFP